MRCISPHEKYSIQAIEGQEQTMMDGRGFAFSQVTKKPVVANFDKTGLLDYEIEAALSAFDFSGVPEGISPLTKISVFDTETYVEANYPEHERDTAQVLIDKSLREKAEKYPSEFIIVDPPRAAIPWPSYDTNSSEQILAFQEALQFSPERIRLYELENQKRPSVIEAMLDLEDPARVEARESESAEQAEPAAEPDQEIVVDA